MSQNSSRALLKIGCSQRWVASARMSFPATGCEMASTALTLEATLSTFCPRRRLPVGPCATPVALGSSIVIVFVTSGLSGLLMSTTLTPPWSVQMRPAVERAPWKS